MVRWVFFALAPVINVLHLAILSSSEKYKTGSNCRNMTVIAFLDARQQPVSFLQRHPMQIQIMYKRTRIRPTEVVILHIATLS
jgi:hypothetical protein